MPERTARFWEIKEEIRILGVDDGPFIFGRPGKALLVATIFRGGLWLEGVLTTRIKVDGDDATDQLVRMISKSRHKGQVRVAMTNGLTFGGFNVIDGQAVFERTGLPLISVTRSKPDMHAIKEALRRLPNPEERFSRIDRAGPPKEHHYAQGRGKARIYFQAFGIGDEDAHAIMDISSTRSLMPEPIRVAHIIASGVVKGESYGRV